MSRQVRSHIGDGTFSDRLVRRMTDSRFRLGTWTGAVVWIASSGLVVFADALIDPGVSLVTPLALVVVDIAWLSTPAACGITVILGSSLGSVQNVIARGVPITPSTFVADAMRLATLAALAFLAYELRRVLEYAQTTAVHYQLTGLLNRRWFFELAEREVARSQRDGTPFTIAVMDLDRFKQINDARGHEAGDDALVRFARHASGTLRRIDVLGRTGGDEFCLVLPLGPEAAAAVVRKVIDVPSEDGQPELRVSAGVVSYPHAPESLHAALIAADKRMYAAKKRFSGLDIEVAPE